MISGIVLLVIGLFLCCDAGFETFEPFRVARRTTADGAFHATHTVRSVADCVRECSFDVTCDVCDFHGTNGTCHLYTWKMVVFTHSNGTGQDANTVMIRRRLEVVRARSWGGQQVAEDICRMFGGEISTYAQLQYAFYNLSLHMGTCGRVAEGTLYYALQYEVDGVGYQGINDCFWVDDGDVFCTIPTIAY